ncbi:hypothetical protein [Methanolobus sp. WCC5]|uniref:hypothetical protein n=1 Tax=Methanolobus sp. WCC5 TaxID=3125785 RepID=UPI003243E729
MNVIQLFISVSKEKTPADTKYLIESAFQNLSASADTYKNDIKDLWNNQSDHIYALYDSKDIVAYQEIDKIKYFIFAAHTKVYNKNSISLDILILSDVNNIDYSVNAVISNIKQTLDIPLNLLYFINRGHRWIYGLYTLLPNKEPTKHFLKLKVLKEADAFLFSYNTSQNDIYDSLHKIKVVFKNLSLNKWEKMRIGGFFVLSLFCVAFFVFGIQDKTINEDLITGLLISSFAFLLSEIPIKVLPSYNIPLINNKLSISVENLSDSIHHSNQPCIPYSQDKDVNDLDNPLEEEFQ